LLTKTLIYHDFPEFKTKKLNNLFYVTFTEYDLSFKDKVHIAFTKQSMDNILGKVIQDRGLKQLRLAETEKYAHVTFFFNGGVEKPFEGESRLLVPSPKIASYDLQPEMSALLVRDIAIKEITENKHDLIVINFANCDMVGHTGVFSAAVKAVETVDKCIGDIVQVAQSNYHIIITADHGNAEKMLDDFGNIFTAHTTNEVPLVLITNKDVVLRKGILADIAPTILQLMKIPQPQEMTGKSLL